MTAAQRWSPYEPRGLNSLSSLLSGNRVNGSTGGTEVDQNYENLNRSALGQQSDKISHYNAIIDSNQTSMMKNHRYELSYILKFALDLTL